MPETHSLRTPPERLRFCWVPLALYPTYDATMAIMAASIESIRQKFAEDQFEFSKHAVGQSIVRQILVREFREAISGE